MPRTASRYLRGAAAMLACFTAASAAALPLSPQHDIVSLSNLSRRQTSEEILPYVGSPHGDWYLSTKDVQCEDLRISLGGGMGPPYTLAVVNASTLQPAENQTLEDVQVLERIGVMGMPGLTWYSLEETSLEVGTPVALQVVDGGGLVGYSVSRHVAKGHLNEFCHYPGAFWPPSRWDSFHYLAILLCLFLLIPFSGGVVGGLKQQWKKRREAFRASSAAAEAGEAGSVPLQVRRRREDSATHVLGDDDERTSLEDEDRPLLREDGAREAVPTTAPPGYEEAVKEDDDGGRETGQEREAAEGAVRLV